MDGVLNPVGKKRGERLDPSSVLGIESRKAGAVAIDHRDHFAIALHRHHQFGSAARVAGDMAGKGVDVFHQLRFPFRRRAAHADPHRNADTSGPPDKGAEHQLAINHTVETDPVGIAQKITHQCSDIRHIGHRIVLPRGHGIDRFVEGGVYFGLGRAGRGSEIEHGTGI